MNLDISFTIASIVAITSIISPIFVALINNRHHSKIRKLELSCELKQKQLSTYYRDKFNAYNQLIDLAGSFLAHNGNRSQYGGLTTAIHNAYLLSNDDSKSVIQDFSNYITNDAFGNGMTLQQRKEYEKKLFALSSALRNDLSITIDEDSKLYKL
ncbi:MAG: hypothetical protein K6G88_05830 [Lachnospiraceae bacterium]|nr:hypothetical protein [Lachnospiraceae bacterium]